MCVYRLLCITIYCVGWFLNETPFSMHGWQRRGLHQLQLQQHFQLRTYQEQHHRLPLIRKYKLIMRSTNPYSQHRMPIEQQI